MKKIMVIVLTVQTAALAGCATTPSQSRTVYQYKDRPAHTSRPAPVYVQPAQRPVYVQPVQQPVYVQPQASPQDEYGKKVLREGLLGAATGAIASQVSGGKAGTGALVGAGTNIIGGALLDVLTAPSSQPQPVQYAPYVNQWNQQNPGTGRIVRKYDSYGNVISENVYTR